MCSERLGKVRKGEETKVSSVLPGRRAQARGEGLLSLPCLHAPEAAWTWDGTILSNPGPWMADGHR